MPLNNRSRKPPRFPLGQVCITPNVLAVLERLNIRPITLLQRHLQGDWGELDPEDIEANEEALREGYRLLSCYRLPLQSDANETGTTEGVKVWIITEADRSITTLLLPEDY